MLRYRSESFKTEQSEKLVLHGHTRILECLTNKDLTGLEGELADHLNKARNDIREHLLQSSNSPVHRC
jgi:DNA-binding GntR family transcriptional regulator